MNTRTLIITFVWMIMSNIGIFAQEHWDAQERIELNKGVFPKNFSKAIDIIQYDLLGIERGKSHVKVIDNNTLYINLSFSLKNSVQQGDWRIAVKPDFLPSFHWAPHLTPTDRNVIDQHVFRSPALIVADDHQTLILIPDLDIMQKGTPVRWYMDMDASSNTLILGMCNNHVSEHVLFERDQETTYPKGDIEIGFYLMYSDSKEVLRNPFKKPLEFMWSRWGHAAYEKGNPVKENLETYVKHTYNWAFNSWSENVWQQFELDGKKVGAPVFIVNVTQSPNYPGEINEREFRSIYNKISQIPMHPTRAGESISVTISEAGFEAMKNDPEYEAWVLNDLQVGWSQPDKWSGICGGAFSTIYYGASKEECHAEMWSAGYNNGNGGKIFNDKSKNSFWERRIENKKRIENQVKKQQEKKRIQKKQAERTAYEEYAQNKRLQ